jgi:hypothetical protein
MATRSNVVGGMRPHTAGALMSDGRFGVRRDGVRGDSAKSGQERHVDALEAYTRAVGVASPDPMNASSLLDSYLKRTV